MPMQRHHLFTLSCSRGDSGPYESGGDPSRRHAPGLRLRHLCSHAAREAAPPQAGPHPPQPPPLPQPDCCCRARGGQPSGFTNQQSGYLSSSTLQTSDRQGSFERLWRMEVVRGMGRVLCLQTYALNTYPTQHEHEVRNMSSFFTLFSGCSFSAKRSSWESQLHARPAKHVWGIKCFGSFPMVPWLATNVPARMDPQPLHKGRRPSRLHEALSLQVSV